MKKLFLIFLVAAFMLPACSEAPTATLTVTPTKALPRATNTPRPAKPTPNAAELEISDPTKNIEVTAGSDFTITVRTSRSPELHWELSEALETNIVDYVWKDHIPDDPSNPTNSSGKDVWRFKAVGPGTTTIVLGYYKNMESTTTQTFAFTVVVK